MDRSKKIRIAQSVLALSIIPTLILAHQDGPDPRKTGAPGDETCAITECHVGTGNPTQGGVEIDFPDGLTYVPGVKQRWTVRVEGAPGVVHGFEVTARPASNDRFGQAGDFLPIDATVQVICETGELKTSSTPCFDLAPIQFAQHVFASESKSFTFDWTPPATDVGPVRVWVAGNAGNGDGKNSGDRIFLNNFTLEAKIPCPEATGTPSIRQALPVLQAFDNSERASSGTWVGIFGENLAGCTRSWGVSDFNGADAPTGLSGVQVLINDKPAYISYISPTLINAQVPDDTAMGPVSVEVRHQGGASNRVTVNKSKVSPALLTTPVFNVGGRQYVAALHNDFVTFVGRENLIPGVAFRPAKAGDRMIVYAVGCGPTNPATSAGRLVSGLNFAASPTQVTFGSTVAQAQVFLEPNFVGLCRFDVTVPAVTGDAQGDIRIDATVDGVPTGQTLFTTVQ